MIIAGNTFQEFLDFTKNKKVIAFGAGNFLKVINTNYPELMLEEKIEYIIDNNVCEENKFFQLGKKKILIKQVENIINEDKEKLLILLASCNYEWEMYEQLQQYEQLKDVPFFAIPLMIGMHKDTSDVYIKQGKQVIEKKIHCFWFSGETKPKEYQECLDSWKRVCPEYEIIEWNTENYDVTKHPYMYAAYKKRKWAFVSDYARLDTIYQYGGIYLDLDVELIRSLDDLLANEFFIGFEGLRHIEAAAFGAKKNSDVIREMLECYNGLEYDNNCTILNMQPVYLTELMRKKGFRMDGTYQSREGVTIYPKDFFSPINWVSGTLEATEWTYGIHRCNLGWHTEKQRLGRKLKYEGLKKMQRLYENGD